MCIADERPTFIPVANVVKCSVIQSLGGQEIVNTFYIDHEASLSAVSAREIADEVQAWYASEVMPLLSIDLQLDHVDYQDLTTVTGFTGRTGFAGTLGGINSPSEASNVAIVVTKRTGIRGRSFRGRNYVAGIPQSKRETPVKAITDWVGQLTTAFGLLNAALSPTTGADSVVSYCHNNAWLTDGEFTHVTEYTSDAFFDSQRRRLQGRGR